MGLMWQQDDWRSRGACLAADPDLFFPISSRGSSSAQANRAKAICTGCQVRAECIDFAIARRDVLGIWGGTTDDERKKLRRNRATAARKLVTDSGSAAA
jgi:WhiB family transcriptional regulator, redox-sensing transcriptional regulator